MKGWIILALLCGALYYLYTETDKLDAPIAKTEEVIKKVENKLDSMTGTNIIKIDQKLAKARKDILERLSAPELEEFNKLPLTPDAIADFKETYCGAKSPEHPVFSRDNRLYICDNL
ncbi:hypothetical protein [Shewanella sp. KJ2020]|jgi:vacuolar-type H+-ATPase subunit F/Vma7|uniref:hypothetical protein n=1 Tax=Shewanella sp. KJ2020 TaxID=2919172 RepID=UPI0020A75E0A|nr:hypothetical protein [Shewanella sp. KJ2020]MCP3129190.1 hypothetical protein [Shewanella sp. KJ2020]